VAGFPAVLVTGPRQSGKTTLLRTHFGDSHHYVSLEAPHVRERALADPVGFLDDHPPPVILDEVQHVPELLSYLQVAIDEDRRPGRWLLSGPQGFPLVQGTTESLAGRVAILHLLPLAWSEIRRRPRPGDSPEEVARELLAAAPPRPRVTAPPTSAPGSCAAASPSSGRTRPSTGTSGWRATSRPTWSVTCARCWR
jgi:hypothetical protein